MDAGTSERVKELTKEVILKFSTDFTKAFTETLIAKVKADVDGEPDEGYQLESAPIPTEPLKTGLLTKMGGFIKNWKTRHFIAYNEADNFKIEYLDKEGGKVRGRVAPAGYSAVPFDDDDVAKHGDFGLKLVGDKSRRVWYFKALSKEERDQWLDIFKISCYKARPQRNVDPVIADAFDIAYWRVRWWYCLWGSYNPWGTEDERLASLIVSILDREVLWEVISKLPGGAARYTLESAIRNPIEASVSAAVGGSWTSATAAVSGVKATLENSVKQLLSPLFEQQKALKEKIVAKVGGIINPVIQDKGGSLLRPVLTKAMAPFGKAFTLAANDFAEKSRELITNNELIPAKFEDSLAYLDRQYYWVLYKACDIIWDFCFSTFAEIISALSNGITYWEVYYMSKDSIYSIYHNAVYTFSKLAKEVDVSQHPAVLADVLRKYANDSKIAAKSLIIKILRALLDTPIQELIMKPANLATEPIQEVIDAIPVPGLSALFNLVALTQNTVEEIIHNALNALVEGGFLASLESEFNAIRI